MHDGRPRSGVVERCSFGRDHDGSVQPLRGRVGDVTAVTQHRRSFAVLRVGKERVGARHSADGDGLGRIAASFDAPGRGRIEGKIVGVQRDRGRPGWQLVVKSHLEAVADRGPEHERRRRRGAGAHRCHGGRLHEDSSWRRAEHGKVGFDGGDRVAPLGGIDGAHRRGLPSRWIVPGQRLEVATDRPGDHPQQPPGTLAQLERPTVVVQVVAGPLLRAARGRDAQILAFADAEVRGRHRP